MNPWRSLKRAAATTRRVAIETLLLRCEVITLRAVATEPIGRGDFAVVDFYPATKYATVRKAES